MKPKVLARLLENLPTCAICKKPVERMQIMETIYGDTRFVVHCHGDYEFVDVSEKYMYLAGHVQGYHLWFTEAFTKPLLPPIGVKELNP